MTTPANDPVRAWLAARGCGEHVVAGGLEGLVDTWGRVVGEVARGYPLTLDDYLNDLDARDLLDRAIALASDVQRDGLAERLAAIDQRFRALTKPSACLWGEEVAADEAWTAEREWWYFAKPKHPGPDLAEDLARAGL